MAQVKLVNSRQSPDEPIRSYYARLKGQAVICDYTVKKLIDESVEGSNPFVKFDQTSQDMKPTSAHLFY